MQEKATDQKGKGKVKNKSKNVDGGKGKDRDNKWNGTQASRQHSSKAFALNVPSGLTCAQSGEHGWLNRKLGHMSSWCFVAVTTTRGATGTMLVDSGADYHICHPEFAKESPSKKSTGLTFRDVQGKHYLTMEHGKST